MRSRSSESCKDATSPEYRQARLTPEAFRDRLATSLRHPSTLESAASCRASERLLPESIPDPLCDPSLPARSSPFPSSRIVPSSIARRDCSSKHIAVGWDSRCSNGACSRCSSSEACSSSLNSSRSVSNDNSIHRSSACVRRWLVTRR